MAKESTIEIAYVPFKTFLTALDTLRQGIPDPVDRSVFRNQSFSTQAMIINSFKALGALDDAGHPQPILQRLVDPATRRSALKEALLERYTKVMDLGDAASDKQFDDCFAEYGVSGDTRKKAKSFFLQAAHMAGIPLSPHIAGARPQPGADGKTPTVVRRRRVVRKKDKNERESEQQDTPPSSSGSRKTIELRSGGGQVTLAVSIDPMELEDDDKDFVFALISALKRYEKGATPTITLGVANSGAAES